MIEPHEEDVVAGQLDRVMVAERHCLARPEILAGLLAVQADFL